MMLSFESCMTEVEKWADNLDMIPPVKAKLFDLFVNGPSEKWIEYREEWPNTTRMLCELRQNLLVEYQNADVVEMTFEKLAEKYDDELKGRL